MRIRKRFHSLITPPDLSSPPPPSMAAAAVAISGAAGGKEGEVIVAAAAEAGGGGGLHGSGGGSGGCRAAGGGGRGLHPNGDLPAQTFHGCTTKPTSPLPFRPPPPEAAAAEGEKRGDLPPPEPRLLTGDVPLHHTHGAEVLKREQDGENGDDGDAHRRWNMDAHSGATAAAPKSLGAEVSEPSLGHGGYKTLSNGMPVASAKAEDTERWSDEERGFPLKKRRGCHRTPGTRSGRAEEEENVVAEREMQPRPSNTRRRRTAASTTTTMAATRTALTSAGTSSGGAPAAAGAVATKNCDDVVVKDDGGDVISAAAAALVDGNRSVGNGKKRRSPAVLMEGSRCSRVNGRGWRCCQQTLVGYSLCEHHLGKGRLRSVSSVRCNGRARKKEEVDGAALSPLPSPLQQKQQQLLLSGDGEDKDEGNPGKRRRKKIGMVKARSISSLLHQPDYSTPTTMAAPEPSPSPSPAPATAAAAPPYNSDSAVA